MQEYAAKTAPLKAYYAKRDQVVELDGLGAPDDILAETRRRLGR
jgi:adenylate kinase